MTSSLPCFGPLGLALLLLQACAGAPVNEAPGAAPAPVSAASPVSAAVEAPPPEPVTPAPTGPVQDIRLFGRVELTGAPAAVYDPALATTAPVFEPGPFAWNPKEVFDRWIRELDSGKTEYGVSIYEAKDHYPPLKGLTVADIGAGYGNNMLAWRDELGPTGRVVFTEIDPNAARFLAYSAHQNGLADQAMVVANTHDDPCLPVGQFDVVLFSQVHTNVTLGEYPKSDATEATFRATSAAFFGAAARALKDENSRVIVIEGFQNQGPRADPKMNYYPEDQAIENIERSGLKLVNHTRNDHLWVASFSRAPG